MSESSMFSASMLQVSISGPDPSQRLQKAIREGQVVRIGRAPKQGWAVPWDRAISREHADVRWENGVLKVSMISQARNPLIHRNKMMKEVTLSAGDWFQIGETKFQAGDISERTIVKQDTDEDTVNVEFDEGVGSIMEEYAYSQEELSKVAFKNFGSAVGDSVATASSDFRFAYRRRSWSVVVSATSRCDSAC